MGDITQYKPYSYMKTIFKKILLLTISLISLGTLFIQVNKFEIYFKNTNSLDPNKILLLTTDKSLGDELFLYSQWQATKLIQIITKAEKENFSKEFAKIFPKNVLLEEIVFGYVKENTVIVAETLRYNFKDTVSLRDFWQSVAFAKSIEKIMKTNYPEVLVTAKGWEQDTIRTEYDDPSSENRLLFKVNLNLINGENKIFVKSKQSNVVVATTINFPAEYKKVSDRDSRFHNSEYESNCIGCHDGLPSSSDGVEFTADCKTCHKAFFKNTKVHSLVEMNECLSCHTWSKESKAVVVERGVPEVCSDCHSEITSGAEKNTYSHPVLNDCLTCHTPHSSNYKKLLKDDVYNICKDCHDGYLVNHPVSNHPVRFRKLSEEKNNLISCVSCHNPHSSNSKALIKVSGGRLAVCISCHNR